MANMKKTYFLCPSFDYPPPPTGPIQLGSILASPFSLDRPLNSKETIVPIQPERIYTTTKREWKSTLGNRNAGSVGVFAKFLHLAVGVGAEANVEWDNANLSEASVEKLETSYFNPMEAEHYIESALETPNVEQFIKKSRFRKPLYMVTGLKIARGGRIATSKADARGMAFGLSVDGSMLTAPIEVGPQMEARTMKVENTYWAESDDFIFGYRLSKINIKRKTGEASEVEYTKGALYEHGSEDSGRGSVKYELDNVEGDDFVEAGDLRDSMLDTSDEDGECRCVVPQKDV